MDEELTRRAALQRAALLGAAALTVPALARAEARRQTSSARIAELAVGEVSGETAPLRAPRRFSLVGVQWDRAGAGERPRVELRTRERTGPWSRWGLASASGHEPDGASPQAVAFGEAVWSGPADLVQLRSDRPLRGVRVHFVSADLVPTAVVASAFPLAGPVLDAGGGQPPIIAREAWAHHHAPPAVRPGYGTVNLAFVHHTENLNGYGPAAVPAMLLAIFDFHRYVRGWNDIGYNFVIDAFGRIWEGRQGGIDEAVVGAQAGGYNKVSTGVAMLGSFVSVLPPRPALNALERLLAWKLSLHGVPNRGHVRVEVDPADAFYTPFAPGARVSLPRIAGHRDGDSTDCPGGALYRALPSIRSRVSRLAGPLAQLSLRASAQPAVAGAVAVAGRLRLGAGEASAGAPIEIQQLGAGGAKTVATATTSSAGAWSVRVPLLHNSHLRALHRSRPAAVSALVGVAVAPAVSLALIPGAPLRVTGAILPAKPRVTIEVYRGAGRPQQLVASLRPSVRGGRFLAELPLRRSGRYTVRARTVADAANAAGASAPLLLTV